MNKIYKHHVIAIVFFILTFLFIIISMTNEPFLYWTFERHHNLLSWYIRPLFLIPFCFFSYKRKWSGIAITIFCLFTSMFWFPKPDIVNNSVIEFLQFEREYLLGVWNVKKILLALLIPISFVLLGLAFWKRSIKLGIGVLILITIGKITWSILNAGESGKSILLPGIIGLVICSIFIFLKFKSFKK